MDLGRGRGWKSWIGTKYEERGGLREQGVCSPKKAGGGGGAQSPPFALPSHS